MRARGLSMPRAEGMGSHGCLGEAKPVKHREDAQR